MNNKEIKALSRNLNKHYHIRALLSPTVLLFFALIFAFLPSLFYRLSDFTVLNELSYFPFISAAAMGIISIIAFIFYSCLSLGEKAIYDARSRHRRICEKRLVFWLKPKLSFKAFRLYFILTVLKLFYLFLFTLPAVCTFASVVFLAYSGGIEFYLFLSLAAGGLLLLFTGLFFSFYFNQRYFLAPYMLAEDPRLSVMQVIGRSKNLLEGRISRIVRFKLSFAPWFLFSLLIFPVFFFHSHYKQSLSIIAKEICL